MIGLVILLVSITGIGSTLAARYCVIRWPEKHMQTHLILLVLKLVIVTGLIILFMFRFNLDEVILILSGYGVLVVFHILEGVMIQQQLVKLGKKDVSTTR